MLDQTQTKQTGKTVDKQNLVTTYKQSYSIENEIKDKFIYNNKKFGLILVCTVHNS